MTRGIILFGSGLLAVGLTVSAMAHGDQHKEGDEGQKVTITGELIDTACFVNSDGDAKGKSHADCASKCMASGIPAGILPDGSKDHESMIFLLTNPTVLAPHAAKTIRVEGTAYDGLKAFDPQKIFVKDGTSWTEVQLHDEHHKASEDGSHESGHDH